MSGAELLGLRPGRECLFAGPGRVRRIERMVVALGTAQQMKLDEARQLIEVAVAPEPALLESLLLTLDHFKPIHRDEHFATPWCRRSRHFEANSMVGPSLTVRPGLGSMSRNRLYCLLNRLVMVKSRP